MATKKRAKKPAKNLGGRPRKLDDPAVIATLVTALKLGAPIRTACDYAEISHVTYYDWLAKAEKGVGPEYTAFSNAVKKASADGEIYLLSQIVKSSAWQAKAWILERTKPMKYGLNRTMGDPVDNEPILWVVKHGKKG